MENYIVINGKRAELTEEQLSTLGIEPLQENVFRRAEKGEEYYYIASNGNVGISTEQGYAIDAHLYNSANYCTDKALMEQRALHETLNRLLWRFSMEHDGDKIEWNDENTPKYCIYYNHLSKDFNINCRYTTNYGATCFRTNKIAMQAIKEVIKPFIAEHPEFK